MEYGLFMPYRSKYLKNLIIPSNDLKYVRVKSYLFLMASWLSW